MGVRTLILADDPSMQDLLKMIVNQCGHLILSAEVSGGEEIPCCDILVCDSEELLNSGLENFQSVLRQCAATPENTILFANTDLDILRGARALGCKIIPKPFRLGPVLDWLDERARSLGMAILH